MNRITIAMIALVGLAAATTYATAAGGPPAGRGQGNRQGANTGVYDGTGPGRDRGLGRMQGQGRGKDAQSGRKCLFDQNGAPLSEEEKQGLLSMRQEEKLARDVYLALYDQWQIRTYRNIRNAEQRHMEAIGRAIERYDLDDPITDDTPGVFADPRFTALYDELITKGSVSLLEGLKVGALIEEMDIADLRDELETTNHPDLQRVYENLQRGSRNHLRAFAAQIKNAGGSYEAQYLAQEDFDKIASSRWERGNGRKAGRGNGQGAGRGLRASNGQGRGMRSGRQGNRPGAGRNGRGPRGRN